MEGFVVLRGRKGKGKVLVSDDFGGDDSASMLEESLQELLGHAKQVRKCWG
eukprot:CAMPEP_0194294798 /NCGR_PEP_ID=MMETSP0169-20130528/51687_1 /TAXON_ID=218684 /ORGANISM="Corethron pennatum, Strain L29A3" /LENGTH=50 /DNA_ID=CAMNT_0039043777 /DNA_START=45 /DNA_END=194 /DNA_ORIENTATION=-